MKEISKEVGNIIARTTLRKRNIELVQRFLDNSDMSLEEIFCALGLSVNEQIAYFEDKDIQEYHQAKASISKEVSNEEWIVLEMLIKLTREKEYDNIIRKLLLGTKMSLNTILYVLDVPWEKGYKYEEDEKLREQFPELSFIQKWYDDARRELIESRFNKAKRYNNMACIRQILKSGKFSLKESFDLLEIPEKDRQKYLEDDFIWIHYIIETLNEKEKVEETKIKVARELCDKHLIKQAYDKQCINTILYLLIHRKLPIDEIFSILNIPENEQSKYLESNEIKEYFTGIEEGREEARISLLQKLTKNNQMSLTEAFELLEIPEEDYKKYQEKLQESQM